VCSASRVTPISPRLIDDPSAARASHRSRSSILREWSYGVITRLSFSPLCLHCPSNGIHFTDISLVSRSRPILPFPVLLNFPLALPTFPLKVHVPPHFTFPFEFLPLLRSLPASLPFSRRCALLPSQPCSLSLLNPSSYPIAR